MTTTMCLILMALFQVKHFLADFPLQNEYMLGKSKINGGFMPLVAHAARHASFTFLISAFVVAPRHALLLALFDCTLHAIIDDVKYAVTNAGRWKPLTSDTINHSEEQKYSNKWFWNALGCDQMLHHLTSLALICFMHLMLISYLK